MKNGNLYRHRNCIDVDIYIVKIVHIGKDSFKAKVRYWNRHGNYVIETDQVVIQKKDLPNWKWVG
jgi:hypothetical protein